jgi:hypothetical protein
VTAGRLFVVLAAFLVVGVAIVGVLWHSLNQVLAGEPGRLLVALPLAIVFVVFLLVFARSINRLARER